MKAKWRPFGPALSGRRINTLYGPRISIQLYKHKGVWRMILNTPEQTNPPKMVESKDENEVRELAEFLVECCEQAYELGRQQVS